MIKRVSSTGFSLVEVVVALGILVMGIGGVLAMFAAAVNSHRRAIEQTTTALIADTVIAEQRALYRAGGGLGGSGASHELRSVKQIPVAGYEFYTVSLVSVVLAYEPAFDGHQSNRSIQIYLLVKVHYKHRGKELIDHFRTIFFRE
jgi:hypothetical protein